MGRALRLVRRLVPWLLPVSHEEMMARLVAGGENDAELLEMERMLVLAPTYYFEWLRIKRKYLEDLRPHGKP